MSGACVEEIMKRRAIVLVAGLLLLSPGLAWAAEAPEVDSGATAWMLTSTALVLLMIPGLAMFYGGLVRSKNVLGTMMHSFAAMGVISVLWVVCGYMMGFGKGAGWCGWDPGLLFLKSIDDKIMEQYRVPEYVFAMFQGKFAIITPALIAGAFAERVRFRTYCVFIAVWGLLVYNPLCHWVWGADGFLYKMQAIDFAGGTVVHISSGISGLVAALCLGARRGYPQNAFHPNNLVMTLMGAGLLWVGWFGFNAGSAVSSSLATAQALTATQTAAAAGALTWIIVEGLHQGKATALGFASGILAGLVAVTPAAGVVQPSGAMALGAIAACVCYCAILAKNRLGYDDSLDAFGIHGVGGFTGAVMLTFFIREGSQVRPMLSQLGVQSLAAGIAVAYAAALTLIIVIVLEKVLGFRADSDKEMAGLDHAFHGERGYGMLTAS
jgi:Amt family ammonium transporter